LPSAALPDESVPTHGRMVAKYARLVSRALRDGGASTHNRNRP
jgi:hypothetical protein